jgi:hypothetical protein
MSEEIMKAGESRVWLFPDGVGPGRDKIFLGCGRIGDPSFNFGDMTRVEGPDPNRYNEFVELGSFQGSKERPTGSVIGRYSRKDLSELLRIGRRRCNSAVQAHVGKCRNPQDFNGGWEKIVNYPKARYTSWSAENFGALGSDEQNPTNETGEFSSEDIYEIKQLVFGEQCAAEVVREIIAIMVCDAEECGDCDTPSDGCQKMFGVMLGTGATPGTLPSVVYSADGGITCAATDIDTLFSNEDPNDAACVGEYLVVISELGGVHFAPVADILLGTEVWREQSAGIDMVGGNGPISIWSVDAYHTWIGGANGHVYFGSSPLSGWTLQDPGIATTLDLQDVHALDTMHVVMVGDLNAIIHTENGGGTWEPLVGPAPGETLNCVWMYDEDTWLVGTSAGGLYVTANAGVTWENIATELPVTVVEVDEIIFHDETIGYLSARDGAAHSLIFRTIDGGESWYVLPEGNGTIPDNDRINSLAVCANENIVWGGGLGGGGTDGIIVKAA